MAKIRNAFNSRSAPTLRTFNSNRSRTHKGMTTHGAVLHQRTGVMSSGEYFISGTTSAWNKQTHQKGTPKKHAMQSSAKILVHHREIRKIRRKTLGRSWMKGHHLSAATRAKISASLKAYYRTHKNLRRGHPLSKATRLKISASLAAYYQSHPQAASQRRRPTTYQKGGSKSTTRKKFNGG